MSHPFPRNTLIFMTYLLLHSGVYVPIGGKKLLTFMDDFNMPAKDTFGSQPPLELIRQWIDYGFFYDRQKQIIKQIKVCTVHPAHNGGLLQRFLDSRSLQGMFLLAAMGPPGGGRMVISRRLQSRFNLINMTFPQVGLFGWGACC